MSHQLALPGHLAQRLTALTARGSQVAALTEYPERLEALTEAIAKKVLYNWDVIVITLGPQEVRSLVAPRAFKNDLTRLVQTVASRAHPATRIIITSPPISDVLQGSERVTRSVRTAHAAALSSTAEQVAVTVPHTTHLALPGNESPDTAEANTPPYDIWGECLAEHLAPLVAQQRLDALSPQAARAKPQPVVVRVEALFETNLAEEPPSEAIRLITERARRQFDTHGVSFNLLLGDRQRTYIGTQGDEAEVSLTDSFCIDTIRADAARIIPDTRNSHDPVPQNDIRFYAGYPIHTTNGVRIGAICVWDYEPRAKDAVSPEVLRDFAIEIEKELASRAGNTLTPPAR